MPLVSGQGNSNSTPVTMGNEDGGAKQESMSRGGGEPPKKDCSGQPTPLALLHRTTTYPSGQGALIRKDGNLQFAFGVFGRLPYTTANIRSGTRRRPSWRVASTNLGSEKKGHLKSKPGERDGSWPDPPKERQKFLDFFCFNRKAFVKYT